MAIKREDLLEFVKSTILAVQTIEDDSSGTGVDGDGVEIKILHLVNPVTAIGSIPLRTAAGGSMQVNGKQVYCAAGDIDEFLKDTDKKDGILMYKGPMHLDVSKPTVREINGKQVVTKAPRIWLKAVKFSRGGAALQRKQADGLDSLLGHWFEGGKVVDLASEKLPEVPGIQVNGEVLGENKGEDDKTPPEVVPNQAKSAKVKA